MKSNSTDRGASIAITHALSIGITALLISGLLLSTGNFLQQQQDRAAYQQLREVGGDMASIIHHVDNLNGTGEAVNVTLSPEYPRTITGDPYNIALITDGATTGTLYLNMSHSEQDVALPISTDTELVQSWARGEDPTVRLCSDDTITLGRCP